MKRPLRERRDFAAQRHDAALARHPTREGDTFERELLAVVDELKSVAAAADDPSSDPVEVAKTYRWLGDAYFDLGRGKDQVTLTQGSLAYQRSEELLADKEAPVEKATLDFNYGNTLRGLSQGFDVGLLEAAQTRYERAARGFRAHHLPELAATVKEQLRQMDPQLRLARKHAEMHQGYERLKQMEERLKGTSPAEREVIARELQDLKQVPGRGAPEEALEEALDTIRGQAERHPERFGEAAGKLGALQAPIGLLASLPQRTPPEAAPCAPRDAPEQAVLRALEQRLQNDAAAGIVSSDRAESLGGILDQLRGTMTSGDGDDLDSMAARAQKMRELSMRVSDMAMSPSWATPAPEPGSRAHRAVAILDPLKRYLEAEKGRGMLPSEEASNATDLLLRLVKLEARIREAAREPERISGFEGEVWRLALAVQGHARRYHLVVARPDFATAKAHAKPKSLFLSGDDEILRPAEDLAARDGLELFERARHGDQAEERWNQLCSASVAMFDLRVPEGPPRAQVCYELGLALALGKPSVVVARPRQKLPFDVSLKPTRLRGDPAAHAEELGAAVRHALGSIVWGGGEASLGAAPSEALAWLDRRFRRRLSDGALRVALQQAERHQDDALAFRRSLEHLQGMLGAAAPALLLPAWPPAYPDPKEKPRCFHVMPFRPSWAKPTRDLAAGVCQGSGWTYSRGDEAEAQRIVPGIWNEIGHASAVLVDVTGHNPNVALELGLVHALGRPYRIVAKGAAEKHMFASLGKVQIHGYARGPRFSGFTKAVEGLLESASAA